MRKRYGGGGARELTVSQKHQLKILRDALRMPAAMRGVIGGGTENMTDDQIRAAIRRLTGKDS